MKKFFIVCEIHSPPEQIEYVTLERWYREAEGAFWSTEWIDIAVDVNSAVDSIIKLCTSYEWESPHYFDSLEEAKEAVEIIIAHDDPNDNNIYKYHIVTCQTITVPSVVCGIQ